MGALLFNMFRPGKNKLPGNGTAPGNGEKNNMEKSL
jgi:hypothetical protein